MPLTPDDCNVLLGFARAGLASLSHQASVEVLDKGTTAMLHLAEWAEAEMARLKAEAEKTEKNGSHDGQQA